MNNTINPFNTPFFQGAAQAGQMNPFGQQGGINQHQMLQLLVALIQNGMNGQPGMGGAHGMGGAAPAGPGANAPIARGPGGAGAAGGPAQGLQGIQQLLRQLMAQLPPQQQQALGRVLDQLGMGQGGAPQGAGGPQGAGAVRGGAPQGAGAANQAFGPQGAGNQIKGGEKGGWLAPHGGYKKVGNGYQINKGKFAGHTATPAKDGKGYVVRDQNGQTKGTFNPPGGKQKIASPLTFDLNGNGKVDTTGVGKKFDINGDGKVDNSAWAGKGDGVLAFDKDGNGKFGEDGTELFGNNTGGQNSFANGFQALKAFAEKRLGAEAVADGKLDKKELKALDNDLRMKVDGQDKRLSELGVDSINLNYEEAGKNADANGNEHRQTGAFTQNGEAKQVNDVWFKYE